MKKIIGIIVFVLMICMLIAISILFFKKDGEEQEKIVSLNIEKEALELDKFYVYGTHYNIEGKISGIIANDIKNMKFVLVDIHGNEREYKAIHEISESEIKILTSDLINEGIYLEDIETGKYALLLKIKYTNSEAKYYSINNNTSYEDIEYYTLTRNNMNKRINIEFATYDADNIKISYNKISVEKAKLPADVYDISIDPGHGGSDPGAVSGNYKEAEIAMKHCLELKKELEKLGLKVILTRDGTEDTSQNSNFSVYTVYNEDGRVNIVGKSRAKYNFSIHLNSSEVNTDNGTEIYAPAKASLDFAQLLADNIVNTTHTAYSNREKNKVSKGVYVRTFTENEIKDSNREARNKGFKPYDITTSTNYLYMIREIGGISTGAYVDGRNAKFGSNLYCNSNIGIESYLVELGYIINKNDLNNMLNNQSAYVQAIVNSIKEHIVKE